MNLLQNISNGRGNGMHPYALFISSPDRAPLSNLMGEEGEGFMVERKAISKKIRFDVFKRDDFTCQYCGNHPPKTILHVDHITAVKNGGSNDLDNLITSCINCNLGKSATPLTSIPESLKDKADRIKEAEEQIKAYSKIIAKKKSRIEEDVWVIANCYNNFAGGKEGSINREYFATIKRFVEILGVNEVLEAMEIAISKPFYSNIRIFKYFCGICWKKIKGDEDKSS